VCRAAAAAALTLVTLGASSAADDVVVLPDSLGAWTIRGPATRYDAETLFDYMNGGAEVYTGYRFSALDVYEYASPTEDDIVVELYWMRSSDDAFGLLSRDWDGDVLGAGSGDSVFPRALYRTGELRLWSDDLFARILAYEETGPSREAVMKIARLIETGRPSSDPPRLLVAVPGTIAGSYRPVPKQAFFFRSHVVLGSRFLVSMRNELELNRSVGGLCVAYADTTDEYPETVSLLLLRYMSARDAARALERYREKVLPGDHEGDVVETEDGCLGFAHSGRHLSIVHGTPDANLTRRFTDAAITALERSDGSPQ